MKLHFHGGASVVTGVNYLLETSKKKLLIDCGLFQGSQELEKKNEEVFPYQPKEIDFVLITHAHLDHIGRLPKLIDGGFQGQILATAPTIDFTRLMLEDSQKILEEKALREGVIPPMDGQRIEEVMKLFRAVGYNQSNQLAKGITARFYDAGHILGSAVIELEVEGKKLVFSGDLGSGRVPLLKAPTPVKEADYIIIESAYGDRVHETLESSKDMVEDIVEETIAQGGTLMIPSFALERTQQLLYHFNELVENRRIPKVPVFVDSPLAIKLTKIYKHYPQYYNQEAERLIRSGDDIFKFPGLRFTPTVKESKAINEVTPPKIIIAGSGMSTGGRILHHEMRYLPDPKSTLLIVTYQVRGTLGRRILDGAKRVEILDQVVPIKARIARIDSYSGHADQEGLMSWVGGSLHQPGQRPQKVFVCQGDEDSAEPLAQRIRDHLGLPAQVPQLGQTAEL